MKIESENAFGNWYISMSRPKFNSTSFESTPCHACPCSFAGCWDQVPTIVNFYKKKKIVKLK